jgi:uncharacterized membrane protein SpoIIM required for sporulation
MPRIVSRITAAVVRNGRFVSAASLLYFLGATAGFVAAYTVQLETAPAFLDSYDRVPAGTIEIFTSNALVLTAILGGVVSFSGTALIGIFTSGFVHASVLIALPVSVRQFLLFFLPHACLELSAVWIAGAVGLRVPYEFTRLLRGSTDQLLSRRALADLSILTVLAYLGIAVAAVIEGGLIRYAA